MEYLNIFKTVYRDQVETPYWALLFIVISYSAVDAFLTRRAIRKHPKVPQVGSRVPFVPSFFLNFLFSRKSASVLQDGYNKFKNSAFQITRADGQVTLLPLSLLDELAGLPMALANPAAALERDLIGHCTGLDIIIDTRLHQSIVQRRLTPRLPLLIPRMEKAVIEAANEYLPGCADWVEFRPYQALGYVVARAAADGLVGPELSSSKIWLDVAFNYEENLYNTIFALRSIPRWMAPLVRYFLPSYWASRKYMNMGKQLLRPKLEELVKKSNTGTWAPNDDNVNDLNLLSWLASLAKGRDREPDKISYAIMLVTLASVHTTITRTTNVIYDLTSASPDLLEELLSEISTVAKNGWDVGAYDRLHRLDSVIRESQRVSPPSAMGMRRLFKEAYTFQDGTHIHAGSYVALPICAIESDAAHHPNPEQFDGLRSFRARQEFERANADNDNVDKKELKELLFSTPTHTALSFGYGKSACPGRFFASVLIKMVVVRLITEYEFKFLPGADKPKNMMRHEFWFPCPEQKILVRRRKEGRCPF